MSLLSMIQDAADYLELPRPAYVMSATDTTTRKLRSLANQEGQDLAQRGLWKDLITEATFLTEAAELQGAISALGTGNTDASDMRNNGIISRTMWNRTENLIIFDETAPADWQWFQGQNLTGPYDRYRFRAGNLYIYPAPTAGQTVAFEYVSVNWCQSSGGTGQSAWAADDDTGVLDERLMQLGIHWRWKASEGLDYAEDFRLYENRVANALAQQGGSQTINLAGKPKDKLPGVVIPETI